MPLKNTQYNTIIRQYDLLQSENNYRLNQRLEEIYAAIPEYKHLDEKITLLSAAYARTAVANGSFDSDKLHQELADIEARKNQLLIQAGYSGEYLIPVYHCADCKDTGYIVMADSSVNKCHCFKQAIVDLVYSQSNIKTRLAKENFEHFNMDWYSNQKDKKLGISPREQMEGILETCKAFIHDFDTIPANLLLYGNTGVGKTFLSNCIAKELLDTAHTVIYLTAFQLIDILEANTFGNDNNENSDENMYDYIFDCDLIIIDDLGTEMNNSFVTSQLFLCINERILHGKSTIISTNLSLEDLKERYSERFFSRIISDYQILPIIGEDIRVKKAISS